MSEWVHSTVGAVTAYQRAGGTPTASTDAYYGGEIPFVTIEDITNGTRFLDKTVKNLSELGLRTSAAWLIKEPHVLYSMYATVGKPIINRIACATNQAIIALRASEAIEQEFLFYQLLFIRPQVYKFTSQTTQSNLNASSVRQLPIGYPKSKATQRKIAAILTSIDAAIERTEALIAKYQQIKAGLMHDLFTRGVLPNGQLRPPREQAPEMYQETAIGWIPNGWMVVRMINLAEDRKGSTAIGPFGSDLVATDYRAEGIPIVFVRDVRESGFEWNSDTYVSPQKAHQLAAHRVTSGEVLASKMGLPPCVSCLYPDWMPDGVITADMIRLSPDSKKVNGYWLTTAINHDSVKRQIAAITAGVTRPKVTLADFRNIKIANPTKEEQERISLRLQAAQEVIGAELIRVGKLQTQKLGLMQDLLTGRVPVKVTEPTPEPLHA
jgi:type I restriction enzyme, S subunit